jgi:hypothetical protein
VRKIGTREEVIRGLAEKTKGGLTINDLEEVSDGRIVSKTVRDSSRRKARKNPSFTSRMSGGRAVSALRQQVAALQARVQALEAQLRGLGAEPVAAGSEYDEDAMYEDEDEYAEDADGAGESADGAREYGGADEDGEYGADADEDGEYGADADEDGEYGADADEDGEYGADADEDGEYGAAEYGTGNMEVDIGPNGSVHMPARPLETLPSATPHTTKSGSGFSAVRRKKSTDSATATRTTKSRSGSSAVRSKKSTDSVPSWKRTPGGRIQRTGRLRSGRNWPQ